VPRPWFTKTGSRANIPFSANAESPASPPGFDSGKVLQTSDCLEIAGGLLAAFGDDLVADFLTFVERTHSGALDGADVHEHILGAIIRLNKAEALLGIEELYSSNRHRSSLSRFSLNALGAHRRGGNYPSFGSSLGSAAQTGSVSARSAENQVVRGDLDKFRLQVNNAGTALGKPSFSGQNTLYELVIGSA
jgi:hypothetical protein